MRMESLCPIMLLSISLLITFLRDTKNVVQIASIYRDFIKE